MRVEATLLKSPAERRPPSDILQREARSSHRPPNRYHLVVRDERDVERARSLGIPVFALRDELVTMLGYPMRFPSALVVPRSMRTAIESSLPILEFLHEEAVARPRIEDIIIALLRLDPLAARAVLQRNRDLVDLAYLVKRVYQENLEKEATLVRLQDFVPLPSVGEALPAAALERVASSNWPKGTIP